MDVFILETDAVQIVILNKVAIVILLVDGGLFAILSLEQGNELRRIAVFLKKVAVALAIAVTGEVLRSGVQISQIAIRDFQPTVTSVRVKREGVVHRASSMVDGL